MEECTKDHPMNDGGNWVHVDAEETGFETESLVEYFCPNCRLTFMVYLGD